MHWATLILFASTQLVIGRLAAGPITMPRGVPRVGNDRLVAMIVMRKNRDHQVRLPLWDTGQRIMFIDV